MRGLLNGAMFNASWLGIVYFHSNLLAPLVACVHVTLHLYLLGFRRRELLLIAGLTLFGALLDQLLFALGVFTLAGAQALAPLWLTCLWPVLATTLTHAFAFLQRRLLLAGALGAIGGCLSYLAGTRLSDVAFASPVGGPLLIAALWAVLMPALVTVAMVVNHREETHEPLAES
jgi:hypothetical protein